MKTRDKALALGGGTALLLGVGLLWPRGDRYPDGAAALARVATLKKGLVPYNALSYLHRATPFSGYRLQPEPGDPPRTGSAGRLQQIHGLTADRYIILHYNEAPGASDPKLVSWEVREGRAPREDVDRGRHFVLGGYIFQF